MAEIKDFARMCKEHTCSTKCPIRQKTILRGDIRHCADYLRLCPEEADNIITEWCKEHPQKTYAQDFLEKFPNARKFTDEIPDLPACDIYGDLRCFVDDCSGGRDCAICWNEVMPDA